MKKIIIALLKIILFIISIVLIVIGQKTIGIAYMIMMLVGLGGIIFLLYLYNRKFR